jgi:hypothetical protein
MGDHTTETLDQLQHARGRYLCCGRFLILDENAINWILNHIDCFVSRSRGNESIKEVNLCPHMFNGHDDEVWDKFGHAIGNLQALERLSISSYNYNDDDNNYVDEVEVMPIPDWERLARILSHVRQEVSVVLDDGDDSRWAVEEVQALARAIRGHPTITSFDSCSAFPREASDALYSALATLPALESVKLCTSTRQARHGDEIALANPESLTELLRLPSLRSVCFCHFYFTRALCRATANALMEGTAVTKLTFRGCAFHAGECTAIMASGLSRNTSVSHIDVMFPPDQALFDALAAALPLNSTLQELSLRVFPSNDNPGTHVDWSPIFLALGKNTGIKTLTVGDFGRMDESLSTAIKDGLELNETLESLQFMDARLTDDNSDFWCRALSFLRTNKALNSLIVHAHNGVTESCLSVFRIDIVTMLQENAALENLSILTWNAIKAEEYIVLVTALQHNRTLKTLHHKRNSTIRLTDDEDKQMAALLKKNYGLENIRDIGRVGDVGAILRLNEAGRRYLVQDGSSISKGVEVLSAVSEEINCVFLHLLENPRLCDRSAVEVASDSTEGRGGSANPANHNGKREQGRALEEGKESRRRQK